MIPKWSVPWRHDDCCAREDGITSKWNGTEHPIIIQWSTSLYWLHKTHLYIRITDFIETQGSCDFIYIYIYGSHIYKYRKYRKFYISLFLLCYIVCLKNIIFAINKKTCTIYFFLLYLLYLRFVITTIKLIDLTRYFLSEDKMIIMMQLHVKCINNWYN